MKIAIVKCPSSNFLSVKNAIEELGFEYLIAEKPKDLKFASKIILPGVGNFKYVNSFLKQNRLMEIIDKKIQEGTHYLGICLGMQLMCNFSTEGGSKNKGFGWVDGYVEELNPSSNNYLVPNMGWSKVKWKNNKIFNKKEIKYDNFYFCHSFHAVGIKKKVLATTNFEENITAAIKYKNAIGVQFHPEKSGNKGLKFIEDFLLWKI